MRSLSIVLALTLSTLTPALLVVQSSPQCAYLCGNVLSATSGSEMTCDDKDYATSAGGATFKACIACELSSTYYDSASRQSDLQWAIYNMRFALSWCLFGFNNNTALADTPCLTSFSCAPLQNAFEYDGLNPNASEYSYCPLMTNSAVSIPKCSQCLAETGNESYLSNFVTALNAACIQQPVEGATLSLQGSVFSSTSVNITTPSPSAGGSYNPSAGGITLGAKIGIAVGGIVVILAALGFCIVWTGKRRRRKILAQKARRSGYEWQAKHGDTANVQNHLETAEAGGSDGLGHGGEHMFFDSPMSTRPFANAWGSMSNTDSPQSANREKSYFSPYVSQYSSPVSATDALNFQEWPRDTKSVGLGVHQEEGERIEMGTVRDPDRKDWREVAAPTLSHPRNGRGAPTGLTEDDARKGYAV